MTFIYGRPVRQQEFLGRESELLTIFNRLRNRESTAIVGEPHIGKTSLLLRASDIVTQENFILNDGSHVISVFIDLQSEGFEYTPNDFWRDILVPLQKIPSQGVTSILEVGKTEGYKNSVLRRLFEEVAKSNYVLAVFLDEFDILLNHPNYADHGFFARLRTLSTTTGGLVIVTSSRLSIAQMNKRGQELLGNVSTSPFFNHFTEVKLGPFDDKTAEQLLNRTPNIFTPQEILFIRSIAGHHPFLLQAMAATLYEAAKKPEGEVEAAEEFYKRISFHFDDLWHFMDDKVRTTAVILSLVDLEGHSAGNSFAYEEIEHVEAFDLELRNLANLGLAQKVKDGPSMDIKHGLFWRGEKWVIGNRAFTWWVRDVVISESRQLNEYDEWLAEKKYKYILTEGEWNKIIKFSKNAPEFLTNGISSLAKFILQEVMKPR